MAGIQNLATLKVLRAFLEDPDGRHYGLELISASGVKAGSLYPILGRLEDEGILESEWEEIDEAVEGRRRRRYYRMTPIGESTSRQVLLETAAALAPPPFKPPKVRTRWAPT